ncbi:hypothetical protein [Buttiauxella massiliensis]|uniref:hypothetical protein n=1 Tax=Buttiauxella massiliensis TaxID=2831590 RepID=UPI00125F562F|nr:hypothetical protein [Buttiauxella massiliensis]
MKRLVISVVITAATFFSNAVNADYGTEAATSWGQNFSTQHGNITYMYNRHRKDPMQELADELNQAWQYGAIHKGAEFDTNKIRDVALGRIQSLQISQIVGNEGVIELVDVWVEALQAGSEGVNTVSITPNPSIPDSDSDINGKKYTCQKVLWKNNEGSKGDIAGNENYDYSILDKGDSFQWNFIHGMRGDSTGSTSGNETTHKAVPDAKLVKKATEADGSAIYELKLNNVQEYDGIHTVVYARRDKPNNTHEYYVTDLTEKTSLTFLNCK